MAMQGSFFSLTDNTYFQGGKVIAKYCTNRRIGIKVSGEYAEIAVVVSGACVHDCIAEC